MGLQGECAPSNCRTELSLLIDTASGSVGFVEDGMGITWLIWQVHSDGIAGAMRCAANEDAETLARFCYEILLGPCIGSSGAPVCH